MPCDCSHMEYGRSSDDFRYGRDYYLHPKREEIHGAGGLLAAVALGIIPKSDLPSNFQELSTIEPLLCYVCTRASRGDPWRAIIEGNDALRVWWSQHAENDARRIALEAANERMRRAKQSALEKLTPEERALLGFNEAV